MKRQKKDGDDILCVASNFLLDLPWLENALAFLWERQNTLLNKKRTKDLTEKPSTHLFPIKIRKNTHTVPQGNNYLDYNYLYWDVVWETDRSPEVLRQGYQQVKNSHDALGVDRWGRNNRGDTRVWSKIQWNEPNTRFEPLEHRVYQ